jgi:hypothetical protein
MLSGRILRPEMTRFSDVVIPIGMRLAWYCRYCSESMLNNGESRSKQWCLVRLISITLVNN